MSLAAQILADASAVFLDTADFAEAATHYPAGDPTGVAIMVIADRDDETSSGTGFGDGNNVDDPNFARSITRAIRLEMLASISVTEEGQDDLPSVFLLADGTYCRAVRVLGSDTAMQTVLCIEVAREALGRAEK